MTEQDKTRQELLTELVELRRYTLELEGRLRSAEKRPEIPAGDAARQERMPWGATIEFVGAFDVARARGVDLSEGGLCFELDDDLPFEMRFSVAGREQQRRARCVWLRRKPAGGYLMGLQFVEPEAAENF